MRPVIAGTAGHIDHGKTALVKALTGIDADRLAEEKRRGITIDIGFAHLELPSPDGDLIRFGFVDVPGHERFVRNMLAGIGGIDLVILVVAADESIKPQTREHFDICRLLSIQRGLVVLTKSDLVDPETLDVVRLELEDYLRGTFLESAPIIPVSSLTGTGLDELKRELVRLALEVPAKDTDAVFRLPIDRVFTMRGFGTVVTGTLLSGTLRLEDEVQAYPANRRMRVRGLQVHGASAEQATAGQRTALNLAGVATEDLARGMVLAPAGLFSATKLFDAQITLLPSAKPLKNRARVHFHVQTAETLATVKRLSGTDALQPGTQGWARFRLESPVLVLPGDRFIIRQFSPVITIGGGIVLDTRPQRRLVPHSTVPHVREANVGVCPPLTHILSTLLSGSPDDVLYARIARRGLDGFSIEDAIAETGWTRKTLEVRLKKLVDARRTIRVSDRLADTAAYDRFKAAIPATLAAQIEKARLAGGIGKDQLRGRVHPILFEAALSELVKDAKLVVTGDLVSLPGKGVQLREDEAAAKMLIEDAFRSAALKVPALKEVLASLRIDRNTAQKIVTLLLRDKLLIKVSDELVFHRASLDALRATLAQYKTSRGPRIDVTQFKNLTGVSRKYAIPLLEYLDRERITRRLGDTREIL